MIYQIAYTSAPSRDLSEQEYIRILEQSRRNNPRFGLTGILIYAGGSFIQVLEGEKSAVEQRLAVIREDPRHHHVMRLVAHERPARHFAEWSMGWYNCPPDHPVSGLVRKFDSISNLDDIARGQSEPVQSLLGIFAKHRFV